MATSASALIVSGGKEPVKDHNWPTGALELANLKSRVGWWEGPPFGGGQWHFLYRGDTAAFQQALDAFAKINAPDLRVTIHEGQGESTFLKEPKNYDWSFVVWDGRSFHQLYGNPHSGMRGTDPSDRFGQPVEPPRIDVYIAGKGGKGIDWAKVKVPQGVTVSDERATAAGYARGDGPVVRGHVYDMLTRKPIVSAVVTLARYVKQEQWEQLAEFKSDASGHFEMTKAPPSFRITVSADGYAPRVLGNESAGPNALKQYTAYLAPAATLRGVVLDTDEKPVGGAAVRADGVLGADGRAYILPQTTKTTTDAAGRFELTGLPRGYCRIHASGKSHAPLDVFKQYNVPSDEISLRVTATGAVEGKVTRPDGTPATDADVSVDPVGERLGKWGGSTRVKPDGSFRFGRVPPGNYTASANPGLAIQDKDPKAKKIEVKANETVRVELQTK